jgi:hypothetical protein
MLCWLCAGWQWSCTTASSLWLLGQTSRSQPQPAGGWSQRSQVTLQVGSEVWGHALGTAVGGVTHQCGGQNSKQLPESLLGPAIGGFRVWPADSEIIG